MRGSPTLTAGVVVGVNQAVVEILGVMDHRALGLVARFLALVDGGLVAGVGIHASVLLVQAWWNWAASVLSFMAVVLAVPPLAAWATASK